jgi:molecular chaperone DnaK (HSP70)
MLTEEESSGEKLLADTTRQKFSSREGGLIQVNDITSHTLGVVLWDETNLEEYVFPMIQKRTPIPATAKNLFGTANANMAKAVVKIVEGESTLPGDCTPLGICDVTLPPFLPKGSPVHLSYQYNNNQVLEVAVEAGGQRSQVLIERNTGIAQHEIPQKASSLGELKIE